MPDRSTDLTRRTLLKAAGAAAAVPLVAGEPLLAAVAAAGDAPRFFTRTQLALVDELSEIVIPADEHSGGARAAKVAAYLDGRLADDFMPDRRERWLAGLRRVDELATEQKGAPFMTLSPEDRVAIVERMASDEHHPQSVEGQFFVELKAETRHAYYTSRIGIHDELEYKGNVMQEDYSGTDVSKG
jgi:gluconate 2-dehydrogenase gamma chain